jgi:nucleoside-diphosphate-sugar epimerase
MNYIIGKRSYLSNNLQKQLKNSKIFSVNEILKNKCEFIKSRKINIIYNHSYPLTKLNCTDDYGLLIKKNIIQLNYFLNYLENKKIKINIFLFSSTSAVYGLEKQIKNFDLKDNNKSLYGALKYLSEINLITQKKKFNYKLIIARVFNIYGPNEKISLISKIINFMMKYIKLLHLK